MNMRRTIHKAAVLGMGAVTLLGSTGAAFAYDLADYPTDFVVDGQFDGKIIVGEKAATSDVLGAIDIASSLQAASVTQEEVEVPGQVGEVSLSGDAFRLETSSDLLELREVLGDVYDTLTESELEALRGGTITTDEGSTEYNQYLRIGANGNSDSLQEMAVNYIENRNEDLLSDFLVIEDDQPFFEWEIEFTEGLESATTNGELSDLEDEVFNIFGTDFTFVNSVIDTGATDDVTLEFMAGDISDTLREGETKTYTIDGVDYEVTAVFISDPNSGGNPEAKFAVNGELTDGLADGSTDTLNNGLQIGVRELLVNSREGVVEFFLGANKIEFTDTDYGSSSLSSGEYAGTVEIGNENIEEGSVAIIGQELSGGAKFEITSIKYRLKADASVGSTIYVPPEAGVREFLDEPEGLLSPTFDIRYEGLKSVPTTDLNMESVSDHSYELTATNIRGKTYDNVPVITNRDGTFKWGDDDDDFWFVEAAPPGGQTNQSIAANMFISDDDYFVLSENTVSASTEKTDSAIMRYDDIDTSDRILTFTDMSTGESRQVTYSTTTSYGNFVMGIASNFVVEGQTYTVFVGNASGANNLSIDLDGDGALDGAEVGFVVKGGGILDFSNSSQVTTTASVQGASSGVAMTLMIPGAQFDDASSGNAESFWWNITSASSNRINLAVSASNHAGPNSGTSDEWDKFDIMDDEGSDDYERAMLDYGAEVEYYNPSGSNDAEELRISFPDTQVGAQVFIVGGTTERSGSGDGTVMRDVVNPIAVGVAVLDKDAAGMLGSENLIIVGGPCANAVAGDFLGNPADCTEGFEPGKAMISAMEDSGNVAILVAGYEAQDTLGASYVLADYETYLADVEGSEVEVVASDLSNLQVMAPSMDDDMEMADDMADADVVVVEE